MQDFYPDLSRENYKEKALDKAKAFFFELVGEAKEAFLARIAQVYGQESYNLLKNYSEGLKLLGKGFPAEYKKQIAACIMPFLPKAKALELIGLRMKHIFAQETQEEYDFYNPQTFYKALARCLNNVVHHAFAQIQRDALLYSPYEEELHEIFLVEKYLFIKKMETLYHDYIADMKVIWENMQNEKNSLENITYFLPYLNATLHLVYTTKDDKGNEITHMSFSPEEIANEERHNQGILRFLGKRETEKTIHHFFSRNSLVLEGTFKEELQNYIAEQELATDYHLKNNEATGLLARNDIQNVLQTYDQSNKLTQTMTLSLELHLRAGKLQAGINTNVYRKKIWRLMGGIGFSLFFCAIGFGVNLWTHIALGLLFLAYNLYGLWNLFTKK